MGDSRSFIDDIYDHLASISEYPWSVYPMDAQGTRRRVLKANCGQNKTYFLLEVANQRDADFVQQAPMYIRYLLERVQNGRSLSNKSTDN